MSVSRARNYTSDENAPGLLDVGALEARLATLTEPPARVEVLNGLAWELRYTDTKRALELSEEAHALARKLGDQRGLAYSLRNQGFCLFRLSDYDAALTHAREALNLFEALDDARGLESTFSTLGAVYIMTGELTTALTCFLRARRLCETLGDKAREVAVFNNIGAVHFYLGDYQSALAYHLRTLKTLEDRHSTGDPLSRSRSLNNVGFTLYKLGDFKEALRYLLEALELLETLEDEHAKASTLNNIGLVHYALGDFERAQTYHQKSLALREAIGDRQGVGESLGNLGTVYAGLEHPQAEAYFLKSLDIKRDVGDNKSLSETLLALGEWLTRRGEFEEARARLEEALIVAGSVGAKGDRYRAHQAFAELCKRAGDLGEALEHFERYCALKDEVFNETSASKMAGLRITFEAERKEREGATRLKNIELSRANAELEALTASLRKADREKSELLVRLEKQAREDPLTGLYNRRHFVERFEAEWVRSKRFRTPLSVALLDIDHFKSVNDTFSHGVGDKVLRVLARLLRDNTRKVDVVARYGGEEFVLLFPETDAAGARAACESVRRAVQTHLWATLHPDLGVTVSVGVASLAEAQLFQDKGHVEYEKLLSLADKKLYDAKQGGRNRVCG